MNTFMRVRLLTRLASTVPLAMDAYASGDAELLADVERWRRDIRRQLGALA